MKRKICIDLRLRVQIEWWNEIQCRWLFIRSDTWSHGLGRQQTNRISQPILYVSDRTNNPVELVKFSLYWIKNARRAQSAFSALVEQERKVCAGLVTLGFASSLEEERVVGAFEQGCDVSSRVSGRTKRTNPIWICIWFGDTKFAIFP